MNWQKGVFLVENMNLFRILTEVQQEMEKIHLKKNLHIPNFFKKTVKDI